MADQTIDLDTLGPKQLAANNGILRDIKQAAVDAAAGISSGDIALDSNIMDKSEAKSKTDRLVAVSLQLREAVIVDPRTESVTTLGIAKGQDGSLIVDGSKQTISQFTGITGDPSPNMKIGAMAAVDTGLKEYNDNHFPKPLDTPTSREIDMGKLGKIITL